MSAGPDRPVSGSAPHRTAPRQVTRAGTRAIEAIFQFETADGRGSGVLRLTPDADDGTRRKRGRCSRRSTRSRDTRSRLGRSRPAGQGLFARFSRAQLARSQDSRRRVCRPRSGRAGRRRRTGRAFDRRAPHAVAGRHADRRSRSRASATTGASAITRWSCTTRCTSITCPTCRFPPNWPAYIPKDKLAGWFEAYVESMELNYWTGTEFEGGSYDEQRSDGRLRCAVPTARSARCTRGTSSWPPA